MTRQPNLDLKARLYSGSRAAGAAVLLIGGLGLIGWALDIATLKSVLPGLVTMKANTALALVLAGGSLLIVSAEQADRRLCHIAQSCAAIVALIGLLTLSLYLLGWDRGIDQLLFKEPSGAVGTFAPGRMAPMTALNFLMIGLALLTMDAPRDFRLVRHLILPAGLIGLLSVTRYAYGVRALYGVSTYTEMAIHTAVAFILLSVGMLWARPARGLMAIVVSDSVGGVVARRFLPAAIGVPFLLGWLSVIGQRAGLYGTEFGVALFGVSSVVVLAVIVRWNAGLLYRVDADRKWAQERLQTAYVALEERVEERTAQCGVR